MPPAKNDITAGEVLSEYGFGEAMAEIHASSEDTAIADLDERMFELRRRIAASSREKQYVFAAERIAAVIGLRQAIEEHGVEIEEELPLSIQHHVHIWEEDMGMLFEAEEGVPIFDRLSKELLALTAQWRDAGGATPFI